MTSHLPWLVLASLAGAGMLSAQTSPPAQANYGTAGKRLAIHYSAPSVRGRKIFGAGGLLSQDPTYPAWRGGANEATAFHTDANIDIAGLAVPKGDYTLYVWVKDPDAWELIISKETGQWGLTYNPKLDLGRVKMTMSKPAKPVETLKYAFSDHGNGRVMLDLSWENHVGGVLIAPK